MSVCTYLQLQKHGTWDSRVDAAFAKLDSNGDGYIDLEELLAQLPFQTAENYDGERLMEVKIAPHHVEVSYSANGVSAGFVSSLALLLNSVACG